MPTARRRRKGNMKKRDISQINNATNENNDHHVEQDFNDGIWFPRKQCHQKMPFSNTS